MKLKMSPIPHCEEEGKHFHERDQHRRSDAAVMITGIVEFEFNVSFTAADVTATFV